MAQVVVRVNERPYTMQCNDGEEDHLLELARLLDAEVANIKRAVGQVGDIRLLLMAGLVIADRLSESVRRIEELEDQIKGLRETRTDAEASGRKLAEKTAQTLDSASKRIETLIDAVSPD